MNDLDPSFSNGAKQVFGNGQIVKEIELALPVIHNWNELWYSLPLEEIDKLIADKAAHESQAMQGHIGTREMQIRLDLSLSFSNGGRHKISLSPEAVEKIMCWRESITQTKADEESTTQTKADAESTTQTKADANARIKKRLYLKFDNGYVEDYVSGDTVSLLIKLDIPIRYHAPRVEYNTRDLR